jgi:hypothetical protein
MDYEKVLLIGGPSDGQWVSVLAGVRDVAFAVLPESAVRYSRAAPDAPVQTDRVFYRREPVQSSKGCRCALFVHGDTDALATLIERYSPKPKQSRDNEHERFEYHFAQARLLNIERRDGVYISKATQEFWVCWRLAQTSGEVPTE